MGIFLLFIFCKRFAGQGLHLLFFTFHSYKLKCQTQSDYGKVTMQFELEICQLSKPEVMGIRRQRLKGDAWVYKRLVEDILSSCKL